MTNVRIAEVRRRSIAAIWCYIHHHIITSANLLIITSHYSPDLSSTHRIYHAASRSPVLRHVRRSAQQFFSKEIPAPVAAVKGKASPADP